MTGRRPTHTRRSAVHARGARARGTLNRTKPSVRRKNVAQHAGLGEAGGIGVGGVGKNGTRNAERNAKVLLTRRRFLFGAVGVGVLAAAAGGTAVIVGNMKSDDAPQLSELKVPSTQVSSLDSLSEVESGTAMVLVGNFELPYGTLVWANDDSVAACLLPTEQSKPLTQIGLLFLGSGECPVVVSQAVGQDDGFEIYDVRACGSGLVWTEADILDGIWRVYSASFDGNAVGTPLLLDEGDADWEMPTLAATDGFAFWQALPQAEGNARRENSLLKRAAFGSDSAEAVYTSRGRMSTPPYALTDSVVITPRTDTSSVRHQLTRIDAHTGTVTDAMILPASMKPLEAGYGENGFMFSFDGIYNYGDGIANLGTYTPRTPVAALAADGVGNAAYSDAAWFRFPRNPSAPPAWCGKWLMVKSTSAVCGIDLAEGTFFSFDVKSGADTYGDYLASTGINSTVVTYSNIDYQPIDGAAQKYCSVRVWAPT